MVDIKLEISQVFDAPIEKVWDAWTKPENLKQWKAPAGMTTPEVEEDLKVGGEYRLVMESDGTSDDPNYQGRAVLVGKFLEIKKPTKLTFTWLWEGAPVDTHTTTVSVLLKKLSEDKTELNLTHSGFPDENMKQEHSRGWESTLKKLGNFLRK